MSLFGSSPPESAKQAQSNQKSGLFDDKPEARKKSGSGLFDDDGTNGDSPWSMPTPKKGGRGDMVKTLLPATDVPESYIDAFDVLSDSEYKISSGQVSIQGVKKVLETSRVPAQDQENILKQITGGKETSSVGRSEFNVILALIGLSIEGEDATLDSVDERRTSQSAVLSLAANDC